MLPQLIRTSTVLLSLSVVIMDCIESGQSRGAAVASIWIVLARPGAVTVGACARFSTIRLSKHERQMKTFILNVWGKSDKNLQYQWCSLKAVVFIALVYH